DFAPIDALDDAVGVERLRGFSLKTFFSEVFRRHTDEEAEAVFSCGAGGARVDGWPVPWVFGRALFLSLAVFAGFLFASYHFKNTNLFPGLILVGSFAVPLSTLILFFELNVWRDISFYQVFRCFLCGAIVSLIFSLFLFDSFPGKTLRAAIGMSSAGVVEEVGKLAALLCVVDTAKSRHLLGGMLLGAAVGAGFAAFESAGYALNNLNSGGLDACVHNLMERGVLAPFGHVVWTAIAGAALWRVKGEGRFHPRMLLDARFLRIAWVPMVLHMIWNCDALQLPFELTRILLGIVAWGVALSLAQEGLRGAAAYGRGMRGAPAPAAPRSASSMALAVLAFVVATFSTGFLVSAGGAFFNRVVLPAITGQ
ncbi:MAG: PrsW family intramembrane metalloprotease, partial [Kiritimatiellae bacterium]|nr:PrsW family intramembrane metalloprotease [Kiritimatiellia bacterium]